MLALVGAEASRRTRPPDVTPSPPREIRVIASKVRTATVAAGIALSVGAPIATAAPTAQIRDGYTLVALLPEFVGALGSPGIAPSQVLPGTLHQRIAYFRSPVGASTLPTPGARCRTPAGSR
jgi:hypothetical protein